MTDNEKDRKPMTYGITSERPIYSRCVYESYNTRDLVPY